MSDASKLATTTYNIDVHSIVRRYNRMLVEVIKSQSANVSMTMPFDVTRVNSYIKAMRAYQKFVTGQPLLDCPETGPTEMVLPTNPTVPVIENESAADLCNLIEIARDELANSQSARLPTNLITFDATRQTAYLDKMDALVAYIGNAEPLDLPESSPMDAVSGPGRQGVNP